MNELRFAIVGDGSGLTTALEGAARGFSSLDQKAVASMKNVSDVWGRIKEQISAGFQINTASIEQIASKAESVFNSTRTAEEKLATKQKELNDLYRLGGIDLDTYGRAMSKLNAEMLAVKSAPLEAMAKKAEAAFNDTRTAEEKLITKQKEIERLFQSGAIDLDVYGRSMVKVNAEMNALKAAPFEEMNRKAAAVINDTRTAEEKLAIKQRELNQLFAAGAINQEVYTRAMNRAAAAMNSQLSPMDKIRAKMNSVAGNVKAMALGYMGLQGVMGIGHMAEEMTNLDAQIRRTTNSEAEFAKVQNQLKTIASDTRSGLSETVRLYTRSATALKEYGYNNQEVLKFTELTNKAMATGGASAGEQTAALQQLAQALASGKLQGDEFRSMAENSPIFLDIMSKSLGVTRGELRKMSEDGKLTTDVVVKAVMGQSQMIDQAFKKMPLTVGGALKQVKTSMMSMTDTMLVQTGIMGGLANGISFVAEHFGTLAIIASTVGLGALSNVAVGAMSASSGLMGLATSAMNASRALLLAAMGNPFTAVIAGVGLAAAALYEYRDAIIEVNGQQQTIGQTASDVWEAVKSSTGDAWNFISNIATEGLSAINSMFPSLDVTWGDVWSGIKSTVSAAAANIFDLTFGLSWNIISAFESMAGRVRAIINSIVAGATAAVDAVKSVADSVTNLDFSGAYGKIKNFTSDVKSAASSAYDATPNKEINFTRASEKISNYFGGKMAQAQTNRQAASYGRQEGYGGAGGGRSGGGAPAHKAASGGGGGGKGGKKKSGGGGGKSKAESSKVGDFEAELTANKRAYELSNELREMSKQEESKFWQTKLLLVKAGSKDAENISKKIAQLDYENQKTALKNKIDIDELSVEQSRKTNLAALDIQLKHAKEQKEDGEISGKELVAIEANIEQQRYELQVSALKERIQLMAKDPTKNAVEIAKLNNQLLDLDTEYEQKKLDIKRSAIKEEKQLWSGITTSIEGLWDKGLDALMNGTLTWRNAMKAIVADIGKSFAKMGADTLKDWVKTNAQKVLSDKLTHGKMWLQETIFGKKKVAEKAAMATKERLIDTTTNKAGQQGMFTTLRVYLAGLAQKIAAKLGFTAQENMAEQASVGISAAASASKATIAVGANAVTAASGAAASQASIPWVGPVLAIAAMGAMMAAVSGMKQKIPSARGGFDIPAGMNPMTQLHEQEMVLPSKHANVIRSLADGNGGSGGGESHHYATTVNYTDSSGRLTPEEIARNSRLIAKAVEKEHRNFRLKKS